MHHHQGRFRGDASELTGVKRVVMSIRMFVNDTKHPGKRLRGAKSRKCKPDGQASAKSQPPSLRITMPDVPPPDDLRKTPPVTLSVTKRSEHPMAAKSATLVLLLQEWSVRLKIPAFKRSSQMLTNYVPLDFSPCGKARRRSAVS
jgi:hypothetical protein